MIINCPGRVEEAGGGEELPSLAASVYPVCSSGLFGVGRRTSLGPGSARSSAGRSDEPSAEQRRRGPVRVRGKARGGGGGGASGAGPRAAGRPGGRPGVRQCREPRSFPLTRRAELRAGPGLSQSLPPPPPPPDAQTWAGCTDGRPAERTAGRCACCDPGAGTRVASVSWASAASLGECRGT